MRTGYLIDFVDITFSWPAGFDVDQPGAFALAACPEKFTALFECEHKRVRRYPRSRVPPPATSWVAYPGFPGPTSRDRIHVIASSFRAARASPCGGQPDLRRQELPASELSSLPSLSPNQISPSFAAGRIAGMATPEATAAPSFRPRPAGPAEHELEIFLQKLPLNPFSSRRLHVSPTGTPGAG